MSRDPASFLKQQAPDLRVHAQLGKDVPRGQVLVAIQKVLAGEVLPNPWSPEAGGSSGSAAQGSPAPQTAVAVVRDLLLAAFTADDLRRLVLYTSNPALRPLADEFGPGDSLAALVEKTIAYCQKRDLLAALLGDVQVVNPNQYARFVPRLRAYG